MLNNLTNFFNIIKGRMVRTSATVKGTDIIALGVVNPNYTGGYLPSAITVADLQTTLSTPSLQQVLDFNHDLEDDNNFQGTGAGEGQSGNSVIAFGREAGVNNTGSTNIFINYGAGYGNTGNNTIGLGAEALSQNTRDYVNAFGRTAGNANAGDRCNFMGYKSGASNSGYDINAFGNLACYGNDGNDVNAFGKEAGLSNKIHGQTIFSIASFPTYVDATAAAAAINLANGASIGCLYLYYDTTLGAVSAVFPV